MIPLLDVNVLVAIAWPNHIRHQAARSWFLATHGEGWATTPATQSGFVRVSSNRGAIPDARSPTEAIVLLRDLTATAGHRFWDDAVAMTDDTRVAANRLVGHRQVTDAHLVAVAISHDGFLATFDRGVMEVVPEAFCGQGRVMVLR